MDLLLRDENLKKAEKEMVEEFCDRHMSMLAGASPDKIIEMWLDWQYARFKVKEEDDYYVIFDFEKLEACVIVSKNLSHAKQEAYNIAKMLNESIYQKKDYPESDDPIDFINYVMNLTKGDEDE